MTGTAKTSKINHLITLNRDYKLGLEIKEIREMSVSQLRKAIKKTCDEHNIHLPNSSRFG